MEPFIRRVTLSTHACAGKEQCKWEQMGCNIGAINLHRKSLWLNFNVSVYSQNSRDRKRNEEELTVKITICLKSNQLSQKLDHRKLFFSSRFKCINVKQQDIVRYVYLLSVSVALAPKHFRSASLYLNKQNGDQTTLYYTRSQKTPECLEVLIQCILTEIPTL